MKIAKHPACGDKTRVVRSKWCLGEIRSEFLDLWYPAPMHKDSQHIASAQLDAPKTARRRAREMRTISQMIALYCSGNHEQRPKSAEAYCGERVCEECAALDAYAVERTRRCRKMETKTSCDECENHCYARTQREAIRRVMRYAGPRMLMKHPLAAIRHLLGR